MKALTVADHADLRNDDVPVSLDNAADQVAHHQCAPNWATDKPFVDGHGAAVSYCEENERGELWASNGEYGTRVNFCPFCGQRARVPVHGHDTVSEEMPAELFDRANRVIR